MGDAEIRLWIAWCEAQAFDGNRYGVRTSSIGRAVLMQCLRVRDPYYNRVMGLAGDDSDRVAEAISVFARKRIPFRVDLNPFDCDAGLLEALAGAGLEPVESGPACTASFPRRTPPIPQDEVAAQVRGVYDRSYYHGTFTMRGRGVQSPRRRRA